MDQLVRQAAEPLALLLCTLISVAFTRLLEAARKRTSSQFLNGVLGRMDVVVADVVGELEHTTIAQLKLAAEDGKLTPAEIGEVGVLALSKIRSGVGKSGLAALRAELGGDDAVEQLIRSKVENEVRMLRDPSFGRTLRTSD